MPLVKSKDSEIPGCAAGENFLGGFLVIFFKTMFGLFLQCYMVVFITLSMHTLKTNLFDKCKWAVNGYIMCIKLCSLHIQYA